MNTNDYVAGYVTFKAKQGNPFILEETQEERVKYDMLEREVRATGVMDNCTLWPDKVSMVVRGRSITHRYPKSVSMEWLINKIRTADALALKRLERSEILRDTPKNHLKILELAEELIPDGATFNVERFDNHVIINNDRVILFGDSPRYRDDSGDYYILRYGTFKGYIKKDGTFNRFEEMADVLVEKSKQESLKRKQYEALRALALQNGLKL